MTARGLALLFAAFVASLSVFNQDVRGDPTPPILVLATVAVATLLCWRWERLAPTARWTATALGCEGVNRRARRWHHSYP
jgi:uncharacterized membrane protein YhhN